MQGRRLPDGTNWSRDMKYGAYWKLNGVWFCLSPNGHLGMLSQHTVTEHEDGTITVNPSILISASNPSRGVHVELWHGFLERGVWREV